MYPGLLFIPFNLICHMTMFRNSNFWPTSIPQSQTFGNDPRNLMKIPSNMFYIYHLWEDTQSLVKKKNLKLTLISLNLNYYLTFRPFKAKGGGGPQKLCCCMCHSCKELTRQLWLNFRKKNLPPPPPDPQVPPLGYDPGGQMKIPADMFYIFHLWEDTQSLF